MADDFDTLIAELLQDTYSAEQQLLDALPEMAEAAQSPSLRSAFEEHLQQTERQVERLERAAQMLGIDPEGEDCEAMEGLIAEAEEIVDEHEAGPMRDAALIVAAQKVEHYEIAAYGSLCALAKAAGLTELKDLLGQTLDEEEKADRKLSALAETEVNPAALGTRAANDTAGRGSRGAA
jgi:ferritin-like metal-binding protein YciE